MKAQHQTLAIVTAAAAAEAGPRAGPVFFNLFAAAEPHISVKNPHGTPWHVMISESNGVGKVEFSGSGNRCPQRSRQAENLWESGAKPSNADDKAAGKRRV